MRALVDSMSNQENTSASPSHCLLGPSERSPSTPRPTPQDVLIAAGPLRRTADLQVFHVGIGTVMPGRRREDKYECTQTPFGLISPSGAAKYHWKLIIPSQNPLLHFSLSYTGMSLWCTQ